VVWRVGMRGCGGQGGKAHTGRALIHRRGGGGDRVSLVTMRRLEGCDREKNGWAAPATRSSKRVGPAVTKARVDRGPDPVTFGAVTDRVGERANEDEGGEVPPRDGVEGWERGDRPTEW
jgi:hypothetical protein